MAPAITHAIVTRPIHQGNNLCQCLRQNNFTARHIPSIIIEPIQQDENDKTTQTKLAQADIAIVTSANAVPALLSNWSKLTTHPQTIIAMGPSTQQALNKAGIAVTHVPKHYSSEGVLALPICQSLDNKKIVILSGEGGKNTLSEAMQKAGAQVHKITLYRRLCPPPLIAETLNPFTDQPTLIIFTSFDSLSNWHAMVPDALHPWLLEQQTLVISASLQNQAKMLGFSKVPWLAENATDQCVLQCMQHHLSLRKAS